MIAWRRIPTGYKHAATCFSVGFGMMLWGFHDGLKHDSIFPASVKNNDIILGAMSFLVGLTMAFLCIAKEHEH